MVGSLQAFWRLQTSVVPPKELTLGGTYHFFRKGIKPTWEDSANVNGGRWVIFINRDLEYVDFSWNRILIGLIGNLIDYADHVTGVVCQRRAKGDRLSIWIRGNLTKDEIVGVGKRAAELLEIRTKKPSSGISFDFKGHPADYSSNVKSCISVAGSLSISAVEASLDNAAIRGVPQETFATVA